MVPNPNVFFCRRLLISSQRQVGYGNGQFVIIKSHVGDPSRVCCRFFSLLDKSIQPLEVILSSVGREGLVHATDLIWRSDDNFHKMGLCFVWAQGLNASPQAWQLKRPTAVPSCQPLGTITGVGKTWLSLLLSSRWLVKILGPLCF